MIFAVFAIHATGKVNYFTTDTINDREGFIQDTMSWMTKEGYTSIVIEEIN